MFKVSIIIPVYNVSQYIERCLLSVINQTYKDIEIILVDDASPDDSIIKVRRIMKLYPDKNISIVTHTKNKGLSAARNTGVRFSTGDYLFFLDSDDAIPENAIMYLVKKMCQNPVDLVVGTIDIIGASSKKFPSLKLSDEKIWNGSEVLNSFLKKEWYEMAWNKLINKKLFFQKNCWFQEGIVHEDNLWSFQIARESYTMIVCEQPTYLYYIRPQSITQKKTEKNFDSLYVIITKILEEANTIKEKKTLYLLCEYLWNLRLYFLKNLIKSNLSGDYICSIYKRIDSVYSHKLFSDFSMPILMLLKYKLLKYSYKAKFG